jgi:hypothetical protein
LADVRRERQSVDIHTYIRIDRKMAEWKDKCIRKQADRLSKCMSGEMAGWMEGWTGKRTVINRKCETDRETVTGRLKDV